MKTCHITSHSAITHNDGPIPDYEFQPDDKTITLIILLTAHLTGPTLVDYHSYHHVFSSMFQNALVQLDTENQINKSLEKTLRVFSFCVVDQIEYPPESLLKVADGLLITGSASSACDDLNWINRLSDFAKDLPNRYPDLKLFGICFGHQLLARALGGKLEKNPLGWELGVRSIDLTDIGKKFLNPRADGTIRLHQSHQDHVSQLPPSSFPIGSTPLCPYHGFIKFKNSESDSIQDISLITVQGHPEFSPNFMNKILDARQASGAIDSQTVQSARPLANQNDDGVWLATRFLKIMGI